LKTFIFYCLPDNKIPYLENKEIDTIATGRHTLKGVVLDAVEKISLKDIPVPKVSSGNVLIQVKACGICGTDVHAYYGDWRPSFPLVLGHELAGVVKKIGPDVKYIKTGDRVSVSPDIYCNNCDMCRSGNEKFCRNWKSIGSSQDGAFAEYCLCPEKIVYRIHENTSFEKATFIEPIACVLSAIKQIPEVYTKKILILGAGSIGLSFIMCLKTMSPLKLDILSRTDEKLKLAKVYGATETFNTTDVEGNYQDIIKEKYDVVIDATGVTEVVENSFNLLDRGGELYIFGLAKTKNILKLNHYLIFDRNIKINGVYPDLRSFGVIIEMLENETIDPEPIISHKYKLDDFMEAFKLIKSHDRSVRKIMISP
jgi:2-desacetyl-2-hydroxyethyl bacteriochlorophyllide A dehydrogenase